MDKGFSGHRGYVFPVWQIANHIRWVRSIESIICLTDATARKIFSNGCQGNAYTEMLLMKNLTLRQSWFKLPRDSLEHRAKYKATTSWCFPPPFVYLFFLLSCQILYSHFHASSRRLTQRAPIQKTFLFSQCITAKRCAMWILAPCGFV